jgi:hypothetical protein
MEMTKAINQGLLIIVLTIKMWQIDIENTDNRNFIQKCVVSLAITF